MWPPKTGDKSTAQKVICFIWSLKKYVDNVFFKRGSMRGREVRALVSYAGSTAIVAGSNPGVGKFVLTILAPLPT